MAYVFGVDGGGTKTHVIIANEQSDTLSEAFSGPANYQTCGLDIAYNSIDEAINKALDKAGITKKDLSYGVFGLSGADEQIDFEQLKPLCKKIAGDVPHEVMNDTWIGLRSGASYGVVSICGTGAGHAGLNEKGEHLILRNMDYILGNRGGGEEIQEDALHYAFRSYEGTHTKTRLETIMPDLFKVETMDQVANIIRCSGIPKEVAYQIPIKVMALSDEGDKVSRDIVQNHGKTEAQYALAVARRLGLSGSVNFVLIGSVFKSNNPWLINAFNEEVRTKVPEANIIIPTIQPAYGAVWLAIDHLNT